MQQVCAAAGLVPEGCGHLFDRNVPVGEFVRGVLAGLGDAVPQVGEGLQRDERLFGGQAAELLHEFGQQPASPAGRGTAASRMTDRCAS
ncbi:hypothetical protein [Streptomyces sp. NPDC091027]|uniref:hypothetical protein n=1 Tax=Streptomyces sp. NPDC091027 TaxID=3365971 RepID=UPI00382CCF6F